jgi:hypothetical protein
MKLRPVRTYAAAQYPTLTEYVSRRKRGSIVSTFALAAGMAALAALVAGCTISS